MLCAQNFTTKLSKAFTTAKSIRIDRHNVDESKETIISKKREKEA